MKIIAFLNAYSQGKGGGDIVFIEIAKRIQSYDKVVVTSHLGRELCQNCSLTAKYLITTCEQEFQHTILTYLRRTLKAMFLKIEIGQEDTLLGTSDFLPDVLPIFLLKLRHRRVRWIQHIFHLIPSSRKIPFFAQRVSFLLIKLLADLVIVDNRPVKNDLLKLGFDLSRISVNYPGIDSGYLSSVSCTRQGAGRYDGVFMARLHPSKGIFDLVWIWKLVCKKQPNSTLGIIGGGEAKVVKRLESLIKGEGLEKNINLLGYLEDSVAFATIKASKIFVFPSYEEGFGITLLEAQMLGLPAVVWDLPAFEDPLPKGVIKVKIGELEKFATAILELLTNPSVCQHLSGEALANASRFNWDRTAKRELELIESKKIFKKLN
jgi:glycosyltransferase involved in cell wall biosynthesis